MGRHRIFRTCITRARTPSVIDVSADDVARSHALCTFRRRCPVPTKACDERVDLGTAPESEWAAEAKSFECLPNSFCSLTFIGFLETASELSRFPFPSALREHADHGVRHHEELGEADRFSAARSLSVHKTCGFQLLVRPWNVDGTAADRQKRLRPDCANRKRAITLRAPRAHVGHRRQEQDAQCSS
jgi:hypothetical protein